MKKKTYTENLDVIYSKKINRKLSKNEMEEKLNIYWDFLTSQFK